MDLIKKDTAQEIVQHRDRALELYREASRLLAEANEAATRAQLSAKPWEFTLTRRTLARIGRGTFDDEMRAELDAAVWRHLFESTGLGDLFDSKRKAEFDAQLEEEPPEVSMDTVVSTAMTLASQAGSMFHESVRALFDRLQRRFRSNDGFGFGRRLIISSAFSYGLLSTHTEDELRDLERAICMVMDEPVPERYGGIARQVAEAHREGLDEVETDHLRVRWYKNGNLHVWLLCDEAREQLNRILAKGEERTLRGQNR